MAILGVRFAGTPNTFGPAYSVGASLAADTNAAEINRQRTQGYLQGLEHTNALHDQQTLYYGAKTDAERQGIDGRKQAADAAGVIAGYNATHPGQGTSNASPAGAAPVPVELPPEVLAATRNYARGTALTATNANDLASGTGKVFGSTGSMFGPQDSTTQRRNSMLYTGTAPNEGTVLGPWDTAGTDEKIRAEAAKPHFFNDGQSVNVRDPNNPSGWRQDTVGGLDASASLARGPLKTPEENVIFNVSEKRRRGEEVTPTEESLYNQSWRKLYPPNESNWQNPDGTHSVMTRQPEGPLGYQPPGYAPAPVVVDPFRLPDDASPIVRGRSADPAAPVVINADGSAVKPRTPVIQPGPTREAAIAAQIPPLSRQTLIETYGEAKPVDMTGDQANANIYASEGIKAEAILQQFNGTTIPSAVESAIASLSNMSTTASQFASTLDPVSQMYFDSAFLFITGKLRKESGAKVEMSEIATRWNQYMSRPGEPEDVTAWKHYIRTDWLKGMIAAIPQQYRREREQQAEQLKVKLDFFSPAPDIKKMMTQRQQPGQRQQQQPHPDDDIVEITPVGP